METEAKIQVAAWHYSGTIFEKYCYGSGAVEPLPKHSHAEYQLGMSLHRQGEYFYRGAYHAVPIGKLSVISSQVIHQPSQVNHLLKPATYLMMQISPELLQTTASELAQQPLGDPFFEQPILNDRQLASMYCSLYSAVTSKSTRLTIDTALEDLLTRLVIRHAAKHPTPSSLSSVPKAIALVRDFLQTHYADNISLAQLSDLAGLSRSYLCRLFHREMGMSLSAYQTQLRINHAKHFLAQGKSIAMVASLTGYYDQSHFGAYFKRLVGTTPGNYRTRTITS